MSPMAIRGADDKGGMKSIAEQKLWEVSDMLSPRIRRLREYYFRDEEREFQNNVMSFTTGIPNDVVYQILDFIKSPAGYPSACWREESGSP